MGDKHQPGLGSRRPVMESISFDVEDCPPVYATSDSRRENKLYPYRVVVEKRPRGIRMQVTCLGQDFYQRRINFNVEGYPYQQAPDWLMALWQEAKDKLQSHGGMRKMT